MKSHNGDEKHENKNTVWNVPVVELLLFSHMENFLLCSGEAQTQRTQPDDAEGTEKIYVNNRCYKWKKKQLSLKSDNSTDDLWKLTQTLHYKNQPHKLAGNQFDVTQNIREM